MKIFGIGFQKTGTVSLHKFFKASGLTARHWPWVERGVDYSELCAPFVTQPRKVIEMLRPVIEAYDAHTDVPYPGLYAELVDTFPDAYFVLTKRDLGSWWMSIAHHWAIDVLPRRLQPYEYIQYRNYVPARTSFITLLHRRMLCEAHTRHIEAVEAFFAGHDRFISFDLADGDKDERLANFLGVPEVPFPKANTRQSRRDRLRFRYHRLTGRLRRDAIRASLAEESQRSST